MKKNTIKIILLVFYFAITLFLSGCDTRIPKDVERVLKNAGANRVELEKLIAHYSANTSDSLKLKAAYFLIRNMDGKNYFKGKLLDNYTKIFESLSQVIDSNKFDNMYHLYQDKVTVITDSFKNKYGSFSKDELITIKDAESLNASFLIKNIDMAFKVWKEQPWGKNINFQQFCDYILPYRISNERPDYDREEIYTIFNPLLDSVRNIKGDAAMACKVINKAIIKRGWTYSDAADMLPSFGAKTLINKKIGVCREMTEIVVYIMRAVGIPVSIDYVPQWPNRSKGHNWNIVLDKDGHSQMFSGLETNPGDKVEYTKKAKVYRKSFSKNSLTLVMQTVKDDTIPSLFTNPNLIDVSDEYFKSSDIQVPVKVKTSNHYAFICVFDNQNWVPIHWSKINKDKLVRFSKMGRDVIYLPGIYMNKNFTSISPPILLDSSGTIKYLQPDFKKLQTMNIRRKYPKWGATFRLQRMLGGKFQGANRVDFKDAENLYEIKKIPDVFYKTEIINSNKRYRFLRYLGPPKSQGNIAEIAFYSDNSDIPLRGRIIGTTGSWSNLPEGLKEKAMDDDPETFFNAPINKADSSWVGIDLGLNKSKNVFKIKYLPANDGNNVNKGNDYELLYWDVNKGWVAVERKIATSDVLNFKNVPSNALYLLHNYTKGEEERIFTYKNGEQVWW